MTYIKAYCIINSIKGPTVPLSLRDSPVKRRLSESNTRLTPTAFSSPSMTLSLSAHQSEAANRSTFVCACSMSLRIVSSSVNLGTLSPRQNRHQQHATVDVKTERNLKEGVSKASTKRIKHKAKVQLLAR